MPNISDFISNLAASAGIKADDTDLKEILSTAELSKITVPDRFVSAVNSGLMTVDAAKNNKTVADYYFHSWASKGDTMLNDAMKEFGIDDATANKIRDNKDGIYTRFKILTDTVKDLESKKASAKTGDKKEYEDQIKALNDQIVNLNKDHQAKLAQSVSDTERKFTERIHTTELNRMLSSFKYGLDLPQEIVLDTAKATVSRELAKRGLNMQYDAEKSDFSLTKSDGMLYFENNAQVSARDVVTKILAENKLLQVSPAKGATPAATQTMHQHGAGNGGQSIDTSRFDAAIAEAQKGLSNNVQVQ